jgi:lipid A 4'-phosphatase
MVLKEHWGRPRPRQIVEFGGNEQFRPYYEPFFGSASVVMRSFPSGHSTCGFYFFCLYFIGKRGNSKLLQRAGITIGILLGTLLSAARIVQGGHFMTDVLISALIMWLTCYIIDYVLFEARFLSNFRKNFFSRDDLGYKYLFDKTRK